MGGSDGGWGLRDYSTPQGEPERSDKIVVLDVVGREGGRGLFTRHCPQLPWEFEK